MSKQSDYYDDVLLQQLMQALNQFNVDRPQMLTTEKRNKLAFALLKVIACIKLTLTKKNIADGYKNCGQYPVNFREAMKRCEGYKRMAPVDVNKFLRAENACVQQFIEVGHLTEEFMDQHNLPASILRRQTPKDQRVLHQQRAVLMNLPPRVAAYNEYVDAQATAVASRAARVAAGTRAPGGPRRLTKTPEEVAAMTPAERLRYTQDERRREYDRNRARRKREQAQQAAQAQHVMQEAHAADENI